PPADAALHDRVRAAASLLELISSDRTLLAGVTAQDRNRLLRSAGEVSHPDAIARRQYVKETKRMKKAEKVRREEAMLQATGIRQLRSQPVFTTPNYFPPSEFTQETVDDANFREVVEPQNCYICKTYFTAVHHF